MKKINLSIAVVLLLCTALPPKGDAFDAQEALWVWKRPPTAELAFDPLSPASVRAFEDNRDLDEDTRFFGQFIVDMSQYLPNICVMATPIKYEGINISNMRLDFGGESFREDVAIDSNVTLNDLDIALYYGIPFVKTVSHDRLTVDLGINVRTIDFEDEIKRDSIDQASENFILPIPMVFAAVQFNPLDVLALEAEGRGISIGGKKSYGLIGRLRWKTHGPIYAAGGYRFSRYEIDDDGMVVNTVISGPFVEAGLSF
ncbi:MAG: TIGR04219 family outer membrane beta-barrel protein [Desulfobacterales bacterium]|jgi:outer membrane protein